MTTFVLSMLASVTIAAMAPYPTSCCTNGTSYAWVFEFGALWHFTNDVSDPFQR
ncbi:MAG: hypothetical protein JRM80_00855 [Nitrososphaerota archaeon]|nr:hypothetical protein [Nitrososphaerota archaeon]MDG6971711.1 hypothetical protein [Nitrososphaerota archaeon]MDG7014933.1 hypothetical protein [Nitrososphaerota archaeon]